MVAYLNVLTMEMEVKINRNSVAQYLVELLNLQLIGKEIIRNICLVHIAMTTLACVL